MPLPGSSKRLQETIQALQLETSSVARALKETVAARERQLVEHDVLKLQVRDSRPLPTAALLQVDHVPAGFCKPSGLLQCRRMHAHALLILQHGLSKVSLSPLGFFPLSVPAGPASA